MFLSLWFLSLLSSSPSLLFGAGTAASTVNVDRPNVVVAMKW